MKRFLIQILAAFIVVTAIASDWQKDILGDGYEMRYVSHADDYSGEVRSTIIRHATCRHSCYGILYIHGYNDYFFQKEMAGCFVDSGINFYATDLRKYGRSILPGQKKFQARDLHEYFADIDSALCQMLSDGVTHIVLMGHSTGGLIASLYMDEHPNSPVEGLILNSPFLAWNFNAFMRNFAIPAVGFLGRLFPSMEISQGDNTGYAESLLKQYHGEWNYNTDWKLIHSQKVEASWIRAISNAQKQVRKNGNIKVPVLLLHSSGSVGGDHWTPEYQYNDAVLNVKDIADIGLMLGEKVTEDTVEGGLHDLSLSAPAVRKQFFEDIFKWLNKQIGWNEKNVYLCHK